jgi:hypothetical protein
MVIGADLTKANNICDIGASTFFIPLSASLTRYHAFLWQNRRVINSQALTLIFALRKLAILGYHGLL